MKRRFWTQTEIDFIKRLYHDHPNDYICEILHRTRPAVNDMAVKLGLHKSPEYLERLNKTCRFTKGQKAFNKGMRWEQYMSEEGIRSASRTQFKKGQTRPENPNVKPAGYEMLRKKDRRGRQYWYIKPADGRRMMPKHRWLWEQAHGTIPRGYNVQFKDGNTLNCVLENLYLISRAKQVKKNYESLPEERKAETKEKIRVSRNKSIRRDKLRLRWGMEPIGGIVKKP